MKEDKTDNAIKVLVVNPPTQQQSEERIKKLSEYLSEIWKNAGNIK